MDANLEDRIAVTNPRPWANAEESFVEEEAPGLCIGETVEHSTVAIRDNYELLPGIRYNGAELYEAERYKLEP